MNGAAVVVLSATPDAADLVDGFASLTTGDAAVANGSGGGDDDDDFEAFKADADTIKPETVAEATQAAKEEAAVIKAVTRQTSLSSVALLDSHPAGDVKAGKGVDAIAKDQTSSAKGLTDKSADTNDDMAGSTANSYSNDKDHCDRRYVTPQDFELLKVVGMGAFGKVLQVRNKHSRQILAMKVISKRLIRRKAGYLETVQAERNILMRVDHPFVVKMHCSFQTREKLFLVMNFLAGGELFLRLGREGIFLERTAAFYLSEIILGVDHLHTRGILHRDLKPENILLGHDGHVCLTDFGLAKDFGPDWTEITNKNLNPDGASEDDDPEHGRARTICGTQEYMAPEMVANQGYTKAADYWSLGCIAYEMLNGLPPFSSKQGSKELFRKIMSERVKMPPGSSAAACKLLKGLLNRNVQARWGAAKSTMFQVGGVAGLKQAEFFTEVGGIKDWDKLEQKKVPPPHVFPVDHEASVQHFHEEFTTMQLPRSVMEMSSKDDRVMRCASTAFRGFSFIQSEFALPQRDAEEMDEYWNSGEDDAESLSETASSKLEVQELQNEQVPEEKKRPPRKRKKKNAIVTSPTPSENGDTAKKEVEHAAALERLKQAFANGGSTPQMTPVPQSTLAPMAATAAAVTLEISSTPVRSEVVSEKTPTLAPAPVLAPAPAPAPPKLASPSKWESVSTSVKKNERNQRGAPPTAKFVPTQNNAQSMNAPMRYQQPQRTATQRQTQPQARPHPVVQPDTQKPVGVSAPGSWASRAHQQPIQSHRRPPTDNTRQQPAQNQQRLPAPPPPASPSKDWRMHSSPRLGKAIERSQLQMQQQVPSWPALGGPASKQQQRGPGNQPKGAWASRGKP